MRARCGQGWRAGLHAILYQDFAYIQQDKCQLAGQIGGAELRLAGG